MTNAKDRKMRVENKLAGVEYQRRLYSNILKNELTKCSDDYGYFAKTYCKITHPTEGHIPFYPYDFQLRVVNEYDTHRFNIVRKCRQLGLSTTTAMYVLWKCLFVDGFFCVILSKSQREAKEFLKKVKVAYANITESDIKGTLKTDTVHEMEFENGSRILSLPSTAGRGFACSLLVLDEAAFCRNMDDLWAEAFPVLSTGGRCIVISTTKGTVGIGRWFFETWRDAEAGENDFNTIRLHWWEHPNYDERWVQSQLRQLGPRRFKQEVLGYFLGTGNTFLRQSILEYYEAHTKDPYLKKEHDRLWLWEPPMPDVSYAVTVDTASGTGTDYSVFHIIRLDRMEQVGEYVTRTHTERFTDIVEKWAKIYNYAFIVCERNSMGQGVADKLYFTRCYTNMLVEKSRNKKKPKPGWTTTMKTRPYITQAIENIFTDKIITINSVRTVRQLQSFIIKDGSGKIEADAGSNDDLVLTLGILAHNRERILSSLPLRMAGTQIKQDSDPLEKVIMSMTANNLQPSPIIRHSSDEDQKDLRWLLL